MIPSRFLILRLLFSLFISFGFLGLLPTAAQPIIELHNGFFYLDGEKVFIKGIGYEGILPGQAPWTRDLPEEVLRADLERITDGHFNTIRSWAAIPENELAIMEEYGLKVIMGIWIDPNGDFGDPAFVANALQQVENVMAYSRNYPNIIAYLIMNEPQPQHIHEVGYAETVALWEAVITLIHEQHPGIPVSISNTCNGAYIDPELFDFTGFNAYPYNPVTINHTHGYQAYMEYIASQRQDGHPLVVTEYGLSVSPTGPGNWGYGGNTLAEQTEGFLFMYRAMLDGAATGSCAFMYSDGWWKGGNEGAHDDNVEEWFGLVEYQNLNDQYGAPRPAWQALKTYQSAIITSPRNGGIYDGVLPVEIFLEDTIASFEILADGALIQSVEDSGPYFATDLNLPVSAIQDMPFTFRFYDAWGQLVKEEQISCLFTAVTVPLPELSISYSPQALSGGEQLSATFQLELHPPFTSDGVLDYAFYPHYGFDYGQPYTTMFNPEQESFSLQRNFWVDAGVPVVTLSAGFDIQYNSWKKRVYQQVVVPVGDWLTDLPPAPDASLIGISPNPGASSLAVQWEGYGLESLILLSLDGRVLLDKHLTSGQHTIELDVSGLPRGIYLLYFRNGREVQVKKVILQ
ncbi:MAG: T9SS type A sorting domain-containing protein [Phaeodactylibacter sp.]|nr:T9SS type A sorting domain-containing protein [Phaeodactylibacter sp.]